ncbi:MAG: HAD family hydrolase [Sphingopyxis sp.]
MTLAAIICDFDGVIADSETLANRSLAESLTAIGLPTSMADSLRDYYGHNWQETQRRIEARLGGPLPENFRADHRVRARAAFANGFCPVPGAVDFLDRTMGTPRAIASSSNADYIGWALGHFGLTHHFDAHIYSADGMARGKPHPDIYLMAAAGLGVDPAQCLAIEDSPTGARAAVAAGMQVVGLVAAGHIMDPAAHAETLRAVGVHHIAHNFADVLAT